MRLDQNLLVLIKAPGGRGGGLLNFGLSGGGLIREGWGAYLKFFDRQRQNYTMSMEFEMLRSFNKNYELLRYITNTIKN